MADSAVIVGEATGAAAALYRVLDQDGIRVRVRTPGALLSMDAVRHEPVPGLVLLDCALDYRTVRRVVERLADPRERPPMVVCFASDDMSRLEPHLRNGMDYLIPPFAACHVRNRLQSGREHLAAVPVADRRDYERELQIGREIQQGFLPAQLPDFPGLSIVAHFAPAREVGGDFYDAYPIGVGSLGFVIADVCDKGVGAALFMALVRSLLRSNVESGSGVELGPEVALRAVRETNAYLVANHLQQAYFATLFFGVLDPATGDLTYLNCGHNPPALRQADGSQRRLAPNGPALGLTAKAQFRLDRVRLESDGLLFCYTDGVTEARDPAGRFLGEPALYAMLAAGGGARPVLRRVVDATTAHSAGRLPSDDIAMLVLHREP